MTDKLREAAQAALKLLDDDDRDCAFAAGILRAALAEPAIKDSLTVQRPWVSLTEEEISAVDWKRNETLHDYSRAIEAKVRERNT